MKLAVRVVPNQKHEEVIAEHDTAFTVRVNVPAEEGKANERVVELIARHFGIAKSSVRILKGLTSKHKIIVIE